MDSDKHLLLIAKNKEIWFSLLNTVEFISLDPKITPSTLKTWLDQYFSSHYTLYSFDSDLLRQYPPVLASLEQPIISDSKLLSSSYEGLRGSTLQVLFLLDNKKIDLSKLSELDFLEAYQSHLSFRAEKFHTVFFELSLSEKEALHKWLLHPGISVVNYEHLSESESEYLNIYGRKIISLIKKNS